MLAPHIAVQRPIFTRERRLRPAHRKSRSRSCNRKEVSGRLPGWAPPLLLFADDAVDPGVSVPRGSESMAVVQGEAAQDRQEVGNGEGAGRGREYAKAVRWREEVTAGSIGRLSPVATPCSPLREMGAYLVW